VIDATARFSTNGNGAAELPPHDPVAERATLGGLMLSQGDADLVRDVRARLRGEQFYVYHHRLIYAAILATVDGGRPVDAVIVAEVLAERGQLEEIGGIQELMDIMEAVPDTHNTIFYAEIVRKHATRRMTMARLRDARLILADPTRGVDEALELLDLSDLLTSIRPELIPFHHLREQNSLLHDPVVDGLLREREVANIISMSKVGKSWLAYGLAMSVLTGRPWLGRFGTSPGRVLLIDNELHQPTLAHRISTVASALEIRNEDFDDDLEVWPLRGRAGSIFDIAARLKSEPRGRFKLIILDAKYRAQVSGASENSNSDETAFYSCVDGIAEMTGAAVAMVHHTSKGNQSDKRVTDVGSGAGAMSRAADTHLVFREHEEPGCVVLEAAVRSFAPVEPVVLRWEFPLWVADGGLDPAHLKRPATAGEQRQREQDSEADTSILKALEEKPWLSRKQIRTETGLWEGKVNRSIRRLLDAGLIEQGEDMRRGQKCEVFRLTLHAR